MVVVLGGGVEEVQGGKFIVPKLFDRTSFWPPFFSTSFFFFKHKGHWNSKDSLELSKYLVRFIFF